MRKRRYRQGFFPVEKSVSNVPMENEEDWQDFEGTVEKFDVPEANVDMIETSHTHQPNARPAFVWHFPGLKPE